jgi:hypothetical protein
MRSKRREICIRILPCGYSHIQFDQQKGVAEIQRRRALVAVEFPLASQCHSSEMNGPTIRARNARPELMFRQVDQGFLQIVCDLCHSPYIQKTRNFSQNLRSYRYVSIKFSRNLVSTHAPTSEQNFWPLPLHFIENRNAPLQSLALAALSAPTRCDLKVI